jgi:hypothetical protein
VVVVVVVMVVVVVVMVVVVVVVAVMMIVTTRRWHLHRIQIEAAANEGCQGGTVVLRHGVEPDGAHHLAGFDCYLYGFRIVGVA